MATKQQQETGTQQTQREQWDNKVAKINAGPLGRLMGTRVQDGVAMVQETAVAMVRLQNRGYWPHYSGASKEELACMERQAKAIAAVFTDQAWREHIVRRLAQTWEGDETIAWPGDMVGGKIMCLTTMSFALDEYNKAPNLQGLERALGYLEAA